MQTRYVKAGGRFLTTADYMAAFNKKYPQAKMSKNNISEVRALQLTRLGGTCARALHPFVLEHLMLLNHTLCSVVVGPKDMNFF